MHAILWLAKGWTGQGRGTDRQTDIASFLSAYHTVKAGWFIPFVDKRVKLCDPFNTCHSWAV